MKTQLKSHKENPLNSKENRLVFRGTETLDDDVEVPAGEGKEEITGFGLKPGTIGEEERGITTLTAADDPDEKRGIIMTFKVGKEELKLRQLDEKYFNEAGDEVEIEEREEIEKKIEGKYEDKKKELEKIKTEGIAGAEGITDEIDKKAA